MSVENSKRRSRASRTNWKRLDAMKDADIDYSDIPKQGRDFFEGAVLWPGPKQQITLRLDPDVLAYFRGQGRRYQTRINAVLRKYVEVQKRRVHA